MLGSRRKDDDGSRGVPRRLGRYETLIAMPYIASKLVSNWEHTGLAGPLPETPRLLPQARDPPACSKEGTMAAGQHFPAPGRRVCRSCEAQAWNTLPTARSGAPRTRSDSSRAAREDGGNSSPPPPSQRRRVYLGLLGVRRA